MITKKRINERIYPTKKQRTFFAKTFGDVRLVCNKGIDLCDGEYRAGRHAGLKETSAALTAWKRTDEYSFLKEADSIALQQVLRDLDDAYRNFFEGRGHPKYRTKHDRRQSYRTVNQHGTIYVCDGFLRLPKAEKVKLRQSLDIDNSKITSVTVEKTPFGKYYVSICP